MSETDNKLLIIDIGRENQYIVENITKEKIKDSFFSLQYKEALKIIDTYMMPLFSKNPQHGGKERTEAVNNDIANNIIAFVGDRGSGKTSCMESVARYLVSDNKKLSEYANIESGNFYALDLIDPASFDDKHNVVSLVIATLYKDFYDFSEKREDDADKRRKLSRLFAKVQPELEWILGSSSENVDDIDKLTLLANAVRLRQNMQELIDCFLDYKGRKDGVLILRIDDIDLNTQCADKMTESIRKYLILPNVLILMSVKVEQLAEVKQLAFAKEYKPLLDNSDKTGFTYDKVNDMVDKFITKFLPRTHRIHMPRLGLAYKGKLEIDDSDTKKEKWQETDWQEAIPKLIWKKIGMRFANTETQINPIVPRNLRELCHLVSMLYVMDDKDKAQQVNTTLFTSYLFNDWAKLHVDSAKYDAIQEISGERSVENINKVVITQLRKIYADTIEGWKEEPVERFVEARYVVNRNNFPANVTLGDVFGVISILEEVHNDIEDQSFFFLVRSLYTFFLNNYSSADGGNVSSDFVNLVGGNYINSNIIETMTPTQSGVKRSYRGVSLQVVRDKIQELQKEQNRDESFLRKLYIVEIIVLCISRRKITKDKFTDLNFRKISENVYKESLNSMKQAYFDINACMFNVLRLDDAYGRFGDAFLNLVKGEDNSLYNKIKKELRKGGIIKDADTVVTISNNLKERKHLPKELFVHIKDYFQRLSEKGIVWCGDVKQSLDDIDKGKAEKNDIVQFLTKLFYPWELTDIIINIDDVGAIRQYGNFERTTLMRSIAKNHPLYKKEGVIKSYLLSYFPEDRRYSKEEAIEQIEKYNAYIGKFKTFEELYDSIE